jgi:type II secretory pathway component PulF
MPLILTPRQLTQRAELYHQLASLTAAGVGLISALGTVVNSPPSASMRRPLGHVIDSLNQGASFSEALAGAGRAWIPVFDLALIRAGEQSGRLDACMRLLADNYNERAKLARQVLSDLAYPAFTLHFAILIFPTQLLTQLVWQGNVLKYVVSKALILIPLYAGILLLLYAGQARQGERWRSLIERVLRLVPMLGRARAEMALARLSIALESLLNAGVSVIEAWPLAASASGSPRLRRTVKAWEQSVEAGQTPAEAVRESGAFPDLFANLYGTGEMSGQLDQTLRRLHQHYQEESLRKMHAFAQWAPRMVYLLIVLLVAYQVISFWSGYFSQLNDIG